MAFFTVDVCHKIVDSTLRDGSSCRVAMHAPLVVFALSDVTKLLKFTCWAFLCVPNGHANAIIRITTDTVFDPFGFSSGRTVQCQKRLGVMAGAKDILKGKRSRLVDAW